MRVNKEYISTQNTYSFNQPVYIVIHMTDNPGKGSNARAHAKAQHDGNFQGMSAHYYVDDNPNPDESTYQGAPHDHGCWHSGVNYGGSLFGIVNNRNSIAIEGCMQAGYNFDRMYRNLITFTKQLMQETGIPASRVVSHYDVCAKNCPSVIRAKGLWEDFKAQIAGAQVTNPAPNNTSPQVDQFYRVRKSWTDSQSQLGAFRTRSLAEALVDKNAGYKVFDWNGKVVHPAASDSTETFQQWVGEVTADVLNVRTGPGTSYAKLAAYPQLAGGNRVRVLSKEGDWLRVLIQETVIGYVCGDYVRRI